MELNDLYFHGFTLYYKQVEKDKDAAKLRQSIRTSDVDNDSLKTIRLVCKIDEDWVKNIEEGLLFVEKAVREERQFIRTEGEVVPVERAKHTSKTTVEHLARHSNFITHVPEKETDNLVPDKLYIVEKESDYAVYENRFLYMMLTYLRDFIAIRLNRIRDTMTTYRAKMELKKNVNMSYRKMQIEIKLSDEIKNDPILLEKYNAIQIIDRIELQYHFVLSLLSTPLMEQVSKAPMLKPPIVKTNTLKMNTNFKTSLALYDYIAAYNTPGYSFEEEEVSMTPFNDETANEFAESIALQAFLTYKSASGISKNLKNQLEINEKKARETERIQREEQLKRLRRRVNESNQTMEEYLVLLETHNRDLEKDAIDLALARKEVEELQLEIKALNKVIEEKTSELEALNEEIKEKDEKIIYLTDKGASDLLNLEQIHRTEIANLIAKHNGEMASLRQEHANEIASLNKAHAEEIARINKAHEDELNNTKQAIEDDYARRIAEATAELQASKQAMEDKLTKEIGSLNDELTDLNSTITKNKQDYKVKLQGTEEKLNTALDDKKRMINDYEDKIYNLQKAHRETIGELNNQIEELNKEMRDLNKDHEKEIERYEKRIDHLVKERQFVEAQLHIIRVEQGKITDEYDYTSRERFEELELQYRAFKQLFKKEWGKTKAKIRQEILSNDNDGLKDGEEPKENKKSKNKKQEESTVEEPKAEDKPTDDKDVSEEPKEEPVKEEAFEEPKIEEKPIEEKEVREEPKEEKKPKGKKKDKKEESKEE